MHREGERWTFSYSGGSEGAVQIFIFKTKRSGLPLWLRGKESTCQCRRLRFDPRSRKIPHATEHL